MKANYFLVLVLSLSLLVDVDASWKFWKKKKDEPSSTENSLSTNTASSTTAIPAKTTSKGPNNPKNANRGIAAAADPALAIGVGNVGGKLHEAPNNEPRKPNPGTEVGLDSGAPKLGGNKHQDRPGDLTGLAPVREKPKVPGQGPALSPEDRILSQGAGLASYPGTSGRQPTLAQGAKPQSIHANPQQTPIAGNAGGKAATLQTPLSTPAARPSTPSSQFKPNVAVPQGKPASPSDAKTWADVAGNGAHQGPSASAPRPGQHGLEQSQSGGNAQPKRPGVSAGGVTGGLIGGAALAGAAASGAPISNSGKVFSSNPTYSKGKAVTDEDLEKLSEALFLKDVNNANKYITLNLQKTTSGNSPKDEAPQPLFQVKPEALQLPTIQKVLSIYDNYKLDTRENEYINPAQRQEESLLVDTFLSTSLMSAAMRFLADKGFIKKDYYEYKDTLRTLWFNLYSRGEGKIGSSGFEHVFLTELKLGTEVSGLHNWIYFNAEELKKRLDYLGYIKKLDLGNKAAIVKVHLKFNGIDKPVSNIFVGTSPELEMALYTVCFFVRPETPCPVSLGGTKFNIITHKFRYRGRDLIGSAYPEI